MHLVLRGRNGCRRGAAEHPWFSVVGGLVRFKGGKNRTESDPRSEWLCRIERATEKADEAKEKHDHGNDTDGISVELGAPVGTFHARASRSEEHTSELQSQFHLVCRL